MVAFLILNVITLSIPFRWTMAQTPYEKLVQDIRELIKDIKDSGFFYPQIQQWVDEIEDLIARGDLKGAFNRLKGLSTILPIFLKTAKEVGFSASEILRVQQWMGRLFGIISRLSVIAARIAMATATVTAGQVLLAALAGLTGGLLLNCARYYSAKNRAGEHVKVIDRVLRQMQEDFGNNPDTYPPKIKEQYRRLVEQKGDFQAELGRIEGILKNWCPVFWFTGKDKVAPTIEKYLQPPALIQ